jgi:hypothetical protein
VTPHGDLLERLVSWGFGGNGKYEKLLLFRASLFVFIAILKNGSSLFLIIFYKKSINSKVDK